MTAAALLAELLAVGLTVQQYPGWTTRGGSWEVGDPIGIMQHHTAPPVPFPVPLLAGDTTGLIKCNINTKPDGTVWLVAYEACNYSSGGGMRQVRNEVLADDPPSANAVDRGWDPDGSDDDDNGNDLFFNFENDHAGNGTSIPAPQHEAIVAASNVVAAHFGLTWRNVISHAEWTARKSDPYWNADRRAIETIREAMQEDTLPNQFTDEEAAFLKGIYNRAQAVDPVVAANQIPNGELLYRALKTELDLPNASISKVAETLVNEVAGPPGAPGEDGADGAPGSLPDTADAIISFNP